MMSKNLGIVNKYNIILVCQKSLKCYVNKGAATWHPATNM